ncbi:hypothetical protein LTR17_012976 [Elasticomyces elasticus]|nr:hypothetical protein LTR17_012976 [Elasticomyces elasticus]
MEAFTQAITQGASPDREPVDITLTADGDVILVLKDYFRHRRYHVSSAILSSASPVFKTMLGPLFKEGQHSRSAEQPQEIELHEDGVDSMGNLPTLMHQSDMDERLGGPTCRHVCSITHIAAYMDKYGCTLALRLVGEALLKRCAETTIAEDCDVRTRDAMVYATIAWSAKAAYLLGSGDLFTQFTRRLILDGIAPYSDIPKLASGEGFHQLPNREILPISVLWMEEQRNKARNLILSELSLFTDNCDSDCGIVATSTTFTQEMARNQEGQRWPPLWGEKSLRSVLQGLDAGGDIMLGQKIKCFHWPRTMISRADLTAIRKVVETEVDGMCYTCARQDKMQSTCEHTEKLKRRTAHPLFV